MQQLPAFCFATNNTAKEVSIVSTVLMAIQMFLVHSQKTFESVSSQLFFVVCSTNVGIFWWNTLTRNSRITE